MSNVCRIALTAALVSATTFPAVTQQNVPPPPRPTDAAPIQAPPMSSGPSLAETMKFIQDKMDGQGSVDYVIGASNTPRLTVRHSDILSGVLLDLKTCSLQVSEEREESHEAADGATDANGRPVPPGKWNVHSLLTGTVPLKDIEKITVESVQDQLHGERAGKGHSEIVDSVTLAVFRLELASSKSAISAHRSIVRSDDSEPRETYQVQRDIHFTFRDEDTADQVAKATLHAMELCAGSNRATF